jgi:hypothetical protein
MRFIVFFPARIRPGVGRGETTPRELRAVKRYRAADASDADRARSVRCDATRAGCAPAAAGAVAASTVARRCVLVFAMGFVNAFKRVEH